MQKRPDSFVRREEQLWPDSGGPSKIFLPPHAVQGGKATLTCSFQGFGPKTSQLPSHKKLFRYRWYVRPVQRTESYGEPFRDRGGQQDPRKVPGGSQGVPGGFQGGPRVVPEAGVSEFGVSGDA